MIKSLPESLQNMTDSAKQYWCERGYFPGGSSVEREYADQISGSDSALRRQLENAALTGEECFMMTIEPRHQGNPDHYDPLVTPFSNWWPLEQMIAELKGRPKAIAEWAKRSGLMVTICYITKFDPVRRVSAHEYALVVSWHKHAAAKAA